MNEDVRAFIKREITEEGEKRVKQFFAGVEEVSFGPLDQPNEGEKRVSFVESVVFETGSWPMRRYVLQILRPDGTWEDLSFWRSKVMALLDLEGYPWDRNEYRIMERVGGN